MLSLCARGHPYYMRKWNEAGVDVSQITSLTDLESLPLTPKQDLMDDPESFRLRLPDLPWHERVLWEVIYTTGTTSEPTPYTTQPTTITPTFSKRRLGSTEQKRSE